MTNTITTSTVPSEPRSRTHIGNKYDIQRDGFVRLAPKTHDISLVGEHIPDISHLAADLQVAVNAAWSRRYDIRYSKVEVLLLRWEDDDLGVETELKDLHHVFTDLFHYGVVTYEIPSDKPDKALKRRVLDFLEHDGVETLLILYYAGHARTSIQISEAPIWAANRNPGSPSLPLGGIQSLFEEADADVLLLYDCCNSAATTASSSDQAHKGVTEVIAACGYETIAPEVGEHSFTHALAEVLSAASKGQPFSVAELHTRVLNRLKCWAPSFIKDQEGKRKEDPAGRLLFERQPRRTPIYSILCEPQPRRSILLSPLKVGSTEPETPAGGLNRGCVPSASISSEPSPSEKLSNIEEGARKRKRTLDEVIEYPQVLLAIRLDRHELDLNAWKECLLRQLPPEAKEIKIEGIFGSFSTLLLLRIPVSVWDLLPDNSAYSFVGFVTTNNMIGIQPQPVDSEDVDETKVSQDSQASSSSIVWDLPVRSQSRETTPTSVRKSRETTPALAFILNPAAPRDIISPPLSVRALSDSSGSPPRSLSPDPTDVETAAYFETPDANIDGSSGEPPSKVSVSFDFVIEEIPEIKFGEPENQDAILPINEGDEEEPNPPQPTKFKFSIWFGLKILHCAEDNTEEWLKHMRREARRKRRSSGRIRASGDDSQDKKSEKPGSSNSVQKRTLSESIGSDTDDEDLHPVTFLGANEVGSSARRLRRKVGERSSLIFDDPPRIAEAEEPESCEEVVEVTREEEEKEKDGKILDRELPYFMKDVEADLEED